MSIEQAIQELFSPAVYELVRIRAKEYGMGWQHAAINTLDPDDYKRVLAVAALSSTQNQNLSNSTTVFSIQCVGDA